MSTSPRTKRSAGSESAKRNGRAPADSVDVTNAIRMDGHLADENDLLREYAETHDPRLKEELVKRFLPLARSLALRYRGASEQLEDLIQVASLGLVKALDGFDLERGRSFIAYAAPTILGELAHRRGLSQLLRELLRSLLNRHRALLKPARQAQLPNAVAKVPAQLTEDGWRSVGDE